MSRYIDIETIKPRQYENSEVELGVLAYDYDEVDAMPFLDIVRCEECKYWEESQYYPEVMVCTYVIGATFTRQHDDFCSRADHKTEQTDCPWK